MGDLRRRPIRAATIAVLMAGAAVTTVGAMPTTSSAAPVLSAQWTISYVGKSNTAGFADVAALAANDVWAVGTDQPPPGTANLQRSIVRRWNGRSWTVVRLPGTYSHSSLFTVAGSSSNDMWVFGQWRNGLGLDGHAFALHFNGSGWSRAGWWSTYNVITDALVFGPRDVWIFGDVGTRHYDGHRWTTFKLAYSLSRASALAASDIWAVGASNTTAGPVLARWHGGGWATQPLPSIPSASPGPGLTDVYARSDSDVWVVGGTVTASGGRRPLALSWYAGKWRRYPVTGQDYLGRVIGDDRHGLWATFAPSFSDFSIVHFANGGWHNVSFPVVSGKTTSVFELTRVPGSITVYAAGYTVFGGYPATNALILRYGR